MKKFTNIELCEKYFEFSAGHFTIFSANHREKMHGHNFTVGVNIKAEIQDTGMAFDYVVYKNKIRTLCKTLNSYFLLPSQSPFLRIEEQEQSINAYFAQEKLNFPRSDVLLLPLRNITVEELSSWFLQQLILDQKAIEEDGVYALTVKVFSSPVQSGSAHWDRI